MSDIGHDQDVLSGSVGGFAPDQPVRVPALAFLREGDDVMIGRHDTGSYAVIPAEAAEVLHRIAEGMTPRQAGAWYAERHDEEIDVLGMLDDLAEIGVLDPPGSVPAATPAAGPVRWQRLGAALFSPVAMIGYGLLIAAGFAAMVRWPELRPHYGQILFTDYLIIVTLVLALGQWPFVLLHEAAHALAGRRLGLPTRLALSHRLHFLVFETAMDALVTVPRRSRLLPMLAGMGSDLVVMALLTLAAAALRGPDGSLPLAARVCLALSYGTLLRIVWQFFFYLRTDLYHLLSLVLGTVDLHGAATLLLRQRIRRLLGRPTPAGGDPDPHPTDRRAARWYVWCIVLGYTMTLAMLAFAVVPLAVAFIAEAVTELDGRAGTANLIDSAAILALTVAQLGLVAFVAVRNRRRSRRLRPAPGTPTPSTAPTTSATSA